MVSKRNYYPGSCFRIFLVALILWGAAGLAGMAEDVIVTKNQQLRGKVRGSDKTGVSFEIPGQGIIKVPHANIIQLTAEAPQIVLKGIEAYEKGSYKEAQVSLAGAATQYLGLDTPWAAKALVYYGRCCLIAGDSAGAEKVFRSFLDAYDEGNPLAMDAELGLAETEVAKNNSEAALPKFQELAAEYDKLIKPSSQQMPYAAATFLGLGKCLEAQKDQDGALNAYLKVIALYPSGVALPEALYRAALIYRSLGKLENANMCLKDLTAQHSSSSFAPKAAELQKQIEPLLRAQQEQKAPSDAASEK